MIPIKDIREKTQKDKLKKKSILNFGYKIHRFFSAYLTFLLLNLFPKIKPNFVSFCMIIISFLGFYFLLLGGFLSQILGIILIYFGFLLDKVDGEIARYKNIITARGSFLDDLYHVFVQSFLISIFCFTVFENSVFFGFMLGLLVFIQLNIRYQRKEREFLFLKLFRFIKNDVLIKQKREYKIIVNILNSFIFKIFSFVERFDLMVVLVFLIILLEKFTVYTEVRFYFFISYFISSSVYLIRLILLNYFYNLDKKFEDLFKKYKLWL